MYYNKKKFLEHVINYSITFFANCGLKSVEPILIVVRTFLVQIVIKISYRLSFYLLNQLPPLPSHPLLKHTPPYYSSNLYAKIKMKFAKKKFYKIFTTRILQWRGCSTFRKNVIPQSFLPVKTVFVMSKNKFILHYYYYWKI